MQVRWQWPHGDCHQLSPPTYQFIRDSRCILYFIAVIIAVIINRDGFLHFLAEYYTQCRLAQMAWTVSTRS